MHLHRFLIRARQWRDAQPLGSLNGKPSPFHDGLRLLAKPSPFLVRDFGSGLGRRESALLAITDLGGHTRHRLVRKVDEIARGGTAALGRIPLIECLRDRPSRLVAQGAAKLFDHLGSVEVAHVGFVEQLERDPCAVENVGLITRRMDRLDQGLGRFLPQRRGERTRGAPRRIGRGSGLMLFHVHFGLH